ncbi:MAG: hypothetical protein JXM73_13860 [Anaerolineae bacterium]|nr:hypothetical protein [Anaerolineae bacterium]
MNNLSPEDTVRLIETDELLCYVVEELGGRIIGVRDSKRQPMPTEPPIYQPPLTPDTPV